MTSYPKRMQELIFRSNMENLHGEKISDSYKPVFFKRYAVTRKNNRYGYASR